MKKKIAGILSALILSVGVLFAGNEDIVIIVKSSVNNKAVRPMTSTNTCIITGFNSQEDLEIWSKKFSSHKAVVSFKILGDSKPGTYSVEIVTVKDHDKTDVKNHLIKCGVTAIVNNDKRIMVADYDKKQ